MNKIKNNKLTGRERGYYVDPILFEDGTYKDYDDYERSMGKLVAQLVDMYKTAHGRKELKRCGLTDLVKKAINSKNSLNKGG